MKPGAIFVACLLIVVSVGAAFAGSGAILLNVQSLPMPWGDPQVYEKLESQLSREAQFEVLRAGGGDNAFAEFPGHRSNLDSLVNWGQEAGGRFLMVVTVTGERLERKKSFSLPLIFHKWETVGIIEGEIRLIDLARGKQLMAEKFHVEHKGPRAFQAACDGDRGDPDIHLTAVQKLTFFGELEEKLANHLTRLTTRVLRNR